MVPLALVFFCDVVSGKKIYARHVLCKIIDVEFKCYLLPIFVIFDREKYE
jgi:hypothetical protein